MIVDTCVWVEHMRREVAIVHRLIAESRAVAHPDVVGEVLLGCGAERDLLLKRLRYLPSIERPAQGVLEGMVDRHSISCKGIGWVDSVLLCTAIVDPRRPTVLTFDGQLLRETIRLGIAFAE